MNPREFTRRVLLVVRRIPPGRVATYGDVAALAGRPGAARAVGNIMSGCAGPSAGIPAHRVIAAGGALGGYGGNVALKRALLQAEGLTVSARRVRRFDQVRWTGRTARRKPAM
jgi:methylated-DNA-[protein]-cysteine S-methyltransferase